GALLVSCHGLLLARRHTFRGLLLAAAAPATLVASPYGLALAGYYRWMLVGSPLRKYVTEWQPTTLGVGTALFFLTALAIVFALTVAVIAASFARPASFFESKWPVAGAQAVATAAGPHGLVLADDVHSDWLLWKEPQLAGRLGYDVRFELLTPARISTLNAF